MRFELLVAAVVLQGCVNTNQITGMLVGDLSKRPDGTRFAEMGKPITALPEGHGTCAFAWIDFGDGMGISSFTNQAVGLAGTWIAPHTYAGWPGMKTVRVKGEAGCYGEITRDISVGFGADGRETLRSAFSPNTNRFCDEVRNNATGQIMPILRAGTGVRIETDGRTFNYGAPSQTFNASGDPTTLAPPGYPFPGLRKFSLVYRIGTQVVQGEAGPVVFVANQNGHLEVCVNDNPSYLADNTGIMLVTITVNERSAPLP